jgi:hypothetical protein
MNNSGLQIKGLFGGLSKMDLDDFLLFPAFCKEKPHFITKQGFHLPANPVVVPFGYCKINFLINTTLPVEILR